MQSSFRASKLILSKVGTAASFGFGLNAGARYSDSQSRHRFALEEALALSRPQVDVAVSGNERTPEVEVDMEVDVDTGALWGYTPACFNGCAVVTALSQLATQPATRPATRPAPPLVPDASLSDASHRSSSSSDHKSPPEGSLVSRGAGENSASTTVKSSEDRGSHSVNQSHDLRPRQHQSHDHVVLKRKHVAQHKHQHLQQPKHLESDLEQHQLQHQHLHSEHAQWREQIVVASPTDEKKETPNLKHCEQRPQWPRSSGDVTDAEEETWETLLEKHTCTICSDLLAVPVMTPCQHTYCGICFHDFQQAQCQAAAPLACPNCREPLQQSPLQPLNSSLSRLQPLPLQPLQLERDMSRDGLIAHHVGILQQRQAQRSGQPGVYQDWVGRRVRFFSMLASSSCAQQQQDQQRQEERGDEMGLELDDLPTWRRDREREASAGESAGEMSRDEDSGAGPGRRSGEAVFALLVVAAVAVWGCRGRGGSEGGAHRSVLRELASALWK